VRRDEMAVLCKFEGEEFDESEFVTYAAEGDVREHTGHPPRHLENGQEIPSNGGGIYGYGPDSAPAPDSP
jgi:hypothetical protein